MKLNQLIPLDTRISMLQTSMNVAGSNYQGKKISAKKLLDYGFTVYKGMIDQISATEKNQILVPKPRAKPQAHKDATALLKSLAKKKNLKPKAKKTLNKQTKLL